MLSYLHGIRPAGRRLSPGHPDVHIHSDSDPATANNVQPSAAAAGIIAAGAPAPAPAPALPMADSSVPSSPPVLPPIPRVASQHGPVRFPFADQPPESDDRDLSGRNGGDIRGVHYTHRRSAEDEVLEMRRQQTSSDAVAGPPDPQSAIMKSDFSRHFPLSFANEPQHAPTGLRKAPPRSYTEPTIPKQPSTATAAVERAESKSTEKNYAEQPSIPPPPQRRPPPPPLPLLQPPRPPPPPPAPLTAPTAAVDHSPLTPKPRSTTGMPPLPSTSSSVVLGSQARSGKTKLNRLNPMTLLTRRRPSHPAQTDNNILSFRKNVMTGATLPDDYDPRIRGNVVHDFSAPRPRPVHDGPQSANISRPRTAGAKDRYSGGDISRSEQFSDADRLHTPVFKEHFGDEIDTWRFDRDDRRNQNSTGISDRVAAAERAASTSPLPPFARSFPQEVKDPMMLSQSAFVPPTIKVQHQMDSQLAAEPSTPPPPPPPERSPPPLPSLTSSPSSPPKAESPFQPAGLPRHMKSNASSRFSFDYAGVGSAAQEKLLEDKHRQKNGPRNRGRSSTLSSASVAETEDFDPADFDADDGLEEKIPGINADDGGDGGGDIDAAGFTGVSEEEEDEVAGPLPLQIPNMQLPGGLYSLGNSNLPLNQSSSEGGNQPTYTGAPLSGLPPPSQISDEDDLYFDDGQIDYTEDDAEAQPFDEAMFDDEESRVYGKPLRDSEPLPPVTQQQLPTDQTSSQLPAAIECEDSSRQSTRPISVESGAHAGTSDTSHNSVNNLDSGPIAVERKISLANGGPQRLHAQGFGLTADNLAAYHDALANAANRAAKEGRFDRRGSVDDGMSGAAAVLIGGTVPSMFEAKEKPHVTFTQSAIGANPSAHADNSSKPDGHGVVHNDGVNDSNNGGSNIDDDDEYDDIIAAANAEALENDDEGFYGQEFGFYAHGASADALYANGGYFGPSGSVAGPGGPVKRSHSGRVNGQDPSLTPITERSEWSQRNSTISLATAAAVAANGNSAAGASAMGLAQIADAMQHETPGMDEMSLSTLMKLRRGAWGGSDISLPMATGAAASPTMSAVAGTVGGSGSGTLSTQPQAHQQAPWQRPLSSSSASLAAGPGTLTAQNIGNAIANTNTNGGVGGPDPILKPLPSLPLLNTAATPSAIPEPMTSPIRRTGAVRPISANVPIPPLPPSSSSHPHGHGGHSHSHGHNRPSSSSGSPVKGHSRNSSGAESVSYIRETDEEGLTTHWVMEKRGPAGEGGVMEVLGREILEGGTI